MRLTHHGTQLPQPAPDPIGERMLRFLAGEAIDVDAEVLERLRLECNSQEQYRVTRDTELESLAAKLAGKAATIVQRLSLPYDGDGGEDASVEQSPSYRAGYLAGLYAAYSESGVAVKEVIEAARREAVG